MFQHPHFYDALGFQRHAEYQAVAERRNRLFRRPITVAAGRLAGRSGGTVHSLPTAVAASLCNTQVA